MDRNQRKMSTITRGTCHLIVGGMTAAVCVLATPSVIASPLSDAAQQLSPGSWVELGTQGLSPSFLDPGTGGSITYYSDSAAWDPSSRALFFIGAPHYEAAKFIQYKESTNSWSSLPLTMRIPIHGYDHNTIDSTGRILYHRVSGTDETKAYNIDTQQWTQLPDFNSGYVQFAGGLAFFPEFGGSGSLVFAQGGLGEVHRYNVQQGTWTLLRSNLAMGNYHNFAEYNPVRKLVLFGGGEGSRNLYTIDAQGTIVTKSTAPISLGIHDSVTTVDPISGDYLVFSGSTSSFYIYDVANDTWSQRAGSFPLFSPANSPAVAGVVAAPIATYGVVMFIKYHPNATKVYLYKHAPGSGTPVGVRPESPTALAVQ